MRKVEAGWRLARLALAGGVAVRAITSSGTRGCSSAAAVTLMDLAGIARLPEPDFNARIQARDPSSARVE
jgi:hypothetical protein